VRAPLLVRVYVLGPLFNALYELSIVLYIFYAITCISWQFVGSIFRLRGCWTLLLFTNWFLIYACSGREGSNKSFSNQQDW